MPRTDVQSHHRLRPVTPPAVRNGQRHFPEETEQQDHAEREAEGPPVDERLHRPEEPGGRQHRNHRQVKKVPGKTLRPRRQEFLVEHRRPDQRRGQQHRGAMKARQGGQGPGPELLVRHAIGPHPVFVRPDITEQREHEPGRVEHELLDRDRATPGGNLPAQRCGLVGEGEEVVAEQQIQQEPERGQDAQGRPARPPRQREVAAPVQPHPQSDQRDDEQQQTPRVTQRARSDRIQPEFSRVFHGTQRQGGRQNQQTGTQDHHAKFLLRLPPPDAWVGPGPERSRRQLPQRRLQPAPPASPRARNTGRTTGRRPEFTTGVDRSVPFGKDFRPDQFSGDRSGMHTG